MKTIAISSVKKWRSIQGHRLPSAISTSCPHCDAMVTFTLGTAQPDPQIVIWTTSTACPSCDDKVTFVTVTPTKWGQEDDPREICMHPAPSSWRQQIDLTENVPSALQRAFLSTVDAYNTQNLSLIHI